MDLRTKFALALVSVSLLSMGLLGALAYWTSSELLQEISIRQLDSLAESKASDLAKVQQRWKDQLNLLIYGDELQSILIDHKSGDSGAMPRLIHLVDHVAGAAQNVEFIKITDRENQIVS